METLIFALIMTHGRTFALYSGNPRKLVEDAQICRPTIMTSVPRVFQRINDEIKKNLLKQSKLTQNIFNAAINLKMKDFKESGIITNPFLDAIVFKKIRAILGGKNKSNFGRQNAIYVSRISSNGSRTFKFFTMCLFL